MKDFAVNLKIDSAIVVGAELLGQIENQLGAVTFRVIDGSINFNKPASIEQLDVRLLDMQGRVLGELAFRDDHAELELNELPAAVYLVEMRSKDMIRSEKIFIKNTPEIIFKNGAQ